MTGPDSDKPAFRDSDRQWFDALSGQSAPDGSPAAREGEALRMALEERRRQVELDPALVQATSDDTTEAQLKVLLQQVRSEGIFGETGPAASQAAPPPPSNVVEFPWWRRRQAWLALAASLFVAVVLVQRIADRPDLPAPPAMMGVGGVQQVRSAAPRRAAEQLVAKLREAQLRPGLYQRDKVYVVDINLLATELPLAAAPFSALGVQPAIGFNRVEIESP